jgi:hypothetical protein
MTKREHIDRSMHCLRGKVASDELTIEYTKYYKTESKNIYEDQTTHISIFYTGNCTSLLHDTSIEMTRQKCPCFLFEAMGNIAYAWSDMMNQSNSAYRKSWINWVKSAWEL